LRAIAAYAWPGNVRELENCLKRATIMAEGTTLTPRDIGLDQLLAEEEKPIDLRSIRDAAEKQAIISAISRSNGNLARASDLLGISRPTLYDLMHKFGLKT
jgi:two-component system NtrC family response regulator